MPRPAAAGQRDLHAVVNDGIELLQELYSLLHRILMALVVTTFALLLPAHRIIA